MIHIAGDRKYPVKLIKAVEEVNPLQKHIMVTKILKFYASELADRFEEVRFTRVTLEATAGTPVVEPESNPSGKTYGHLPFWEVEDVPDMAFERCNIDQKPNSLSVLRSNRTLIRVQ